MEMALGNGNAERDNVPDLPSEENETSQRYMPVDLRHRLDPAFVCFDRGGGRCRDVVVMRP